MIIRVKKDDNYSVMSNAHLNDERLSFKAKGMLSYLLSKPDDWNLNVKHLITTSTDGRDSVYAGIKELEKTGYIKKK